MDFIRLLISCVYLLSLEAMDDNDKVYLGEYASDESTDADATEQESVQLYPIKFRDCGSTYARKLYDVDGFVLLGDDGSLLNVYNKAMKRAFDNKKIRVIHNMKGEYVYFITSESQRQRFINERENGCPDLHDRTYYIYRDES